MLCRFWWIRRPELFLPETLFTSYSKNKRCNHTALFSWRPMKRDEGEGQIHCVTLPRVPSRRNSQYSYSPLVAAQAGHETSCTEGKRKKKVESERQEHVTIHGSYVQTQGSPYSQTRILCNANAPTQPPRGSTIGPAHRSALLHPADLTLQY